VKIPPLVLKKAGSYGLEFSKAGKSAKNFGNQSIYRTRTRQRGDARKGKIGELMFAEMLEEMGYTILFDEEIRQGANVGDGGRDIVAYIHEGIKHSPPLKIDIKTTSERGLWLLVETHRFTADAYVLMQVSDTEANYKGFALSGDFFNEDGNPIYEYRSGDKLRNARRPDQLLGITLDAPHQYGLPYSNLRQTNLVGHLFGG